MVKCRKIGLGFRTKPDKVFAFVIYSMIITPKKKSLFKDDFLILYQLALPDFIILAL